MERLIGAVRDLASARTLEEIAEVVRHAARDLSRADGATFVLREPGHCYYMDEDAIAPLWRGLRFPMETCISGWAMLHKQGVVIPDIYLDDRIPHDAFRPTFVQSLAISPIRTTDPIGAIGSYWASHHQATSTELRLLHPTEVRSSPSPCPTWPLATAPPMDAPITPGVIEPTLQFP